MKAYMYLLVLVSLFTFTGCCKHYKKIHGVGDRYYSGIVYLEAAQFNSTGIIRVYDFVDKYELNEDYIPGILYHQKSGIYRGDTVQFKIRGLHTGGTVAIDVEESSELLPRDIKMQHFNFNLHRLSDHNDQAHKKGHVTSLHGHVGASLTLDGIDYFKYKIEYESGSTEEFYTTDSNLMEGDEVEYFVNEQSTQEINGSIIYIFSLQLHDHIHVME